MPQLPPLPSDQPWVQPTDDQQRDRRIIATLATILASGLALAALAAAIIEALLSSGVGLLAARAAWRLFRPALGILPGGTGVAGQLIADTEANYRAAYLLNAGRRLNQSLRPGSSPAERRAALAQERRYLELHIAATRKRAAVAKQIDEQARIHGAVLGWKAVKDSRTSAECWAADGKNFSVARPPVIGWPGSVHVHCRCRATAPYPTDALVDDAVLSRV